jgi:dihydroflavonol-4-reductase
LDNKSPKKVLITGGTGLVGKEIVRQFNHNGYKVRVLTRNANTYLNSEIEIMEGDIRNCDVVNKAVKGTYAVIHCAGEKNDKKLMKSVNIDGTKNVINAVKKHRIGFLCHLSSVGVIGKVNSQTVDENTSCNPMNLYEETKREAERVIENETGCINAVILRPTNVYNESIVNQYTNLTRLQLLKLRLKANENANLVYVKDVAAAVFYLMGFNRQQGNQTFIISSDEETGNSVKEIYNQINRYLEGKNIYLKFCFPIEFPWIIRILKNKKTNRGTIIYSSRKLFDTGFRMTYGLQKGIIEIVAKNTN